MCMYIYIYIVYQILIIYFKTIDILYIHYTYRYYVSIKCDYIYIIINFAWIMCICICMVSRSISINYRNHDQHDFIGKLNTINLLYLQANKYSCHHYTYLSNYCVLMYTNFGNTILIIVIVRKTMLIVCIINGESPVCQPSSFIICRTRVSWQINLQLVHGVPKPTYRLVISRMITLWLVRGVVWNLGMLSSRAWLRNPQFQTDPNRPKPGRKKTID